MKGWGFDDSIQLYKEPVFEHTHRALSEAGVDHSFSYNVLANLKRYIGQGLLFLEKDLIVGGVPDHFITTENNVILLLIEIKTKWSIDCNDIVLNLMITVSKKRIVLQ